MSGPGLPTTITAGNAGHITQHNTIHGMLNKFDKDITPVNDYILQWNSTTSLWEPTVNDASTITAGILDLNRIGSYTNLRICIACDNTLGSRPTIPAGMQLIVIGGTSAVSWLIAGDLQLMSP